MNQSFGTILRKPSAFVPLAMSITALVLLAGAYIFAVTAGHGGLQREPDEGSIAHLWQLLMAGQLPVLLFSESNGCREFPGRHCMFLLYRLEQRSQPWRQFIFCIYELSESCGAIISGSTRVTASLPH